MPKYEGYVHLEHIEFEVEGDDPDAFEVEQAFNEATQARMDGGYQGTDDWDYKEVE